MNWIVRVYDKNDKEIDSWEITDCIKKEAFKEAEADVNRMGKKVADWTLTPEKQNKVTQKSPFGMWS